MAGRFFWTIKAGVAPLEDWRGSSGHDTERILDEIGYFDENVHTLYKTVYSSNKKLKTKYGYNRNID